MLIIMKNYHKIVNLQSIVTFKKLEMSERDKLMLRDKKVNIYLLLYI